MVNQYYGLKLQELCEAKEITKNEIIKKYVNYHLK